MRILSQDVLDDIATLRRDDLVFVVREQKAFGFLWGWGLGCGVMISCFIFCNLVFGG